MARMLRVALFGAAVVALLVPSGAGAVQGAAEFYARGPGLNGVSCAIYDGSGGSPVALCSFVTKQTQAKATLRPNGSVVLCRTHKITSNRCGLGNIGEGAKTYAVGKTVTVGRFACTVQSGGVRCVVTASGEGFLFGTGQMRGVGGASVTQR
jgi:hypothetical protein